MEHPPFALLIAHGIRDWNTWKSAFDEHQPSRRAAGLLGHHISRDVDDSSSLYIDCPASDAERMRAFVDGPDLPDVMERAGVLGPPTVVFLKPVTTEIIRDRGLAGVIVKHTVEDYDRWRAVFDDRAASRKAGGIVGHAVSLDMLQENHVVVHLQAGDVSSLRTFMDSSELKSAMQRGGVKATPEIHFIENAEWVQYG